MKTLQDEPITGRHINVGHVDEIVVFDQKNWGLELSNGMNFLIFVFLLQCRVHEQVFAVLFLQSTKLFVACSYLSRNFIADR